MVLCAFCVLPVNAEIVTINENPKSYSDIIGTCTFSVGSSAPTSAYTAKLNYLILYGHRDNFKDLIYLSYKAENEVLHDSPNYPSTLLLDNLPSNIIGYELPIEFGENGNIGNGKIVFSRLSYSINILQWDYEMLNENATVHEIPITIYDNINERELYLSAQNWMFPVNSINTQHTVTGNTDAFVMFGSVANNPRIMSGTRPITTFITSSQIWNIEIFGTYNTDNGNLYIDIDNTGANYFNISIREINKVNPFYTYSGSDIHKIIDTNAPNKAPIVIRIADINDNYYLYTYPKNANNQTLGTIQTYDYQTGNMVSGVNMTVYKVLDYGTYMELGDIIYSSRNADSQTILNIEYNSEYFVQNELDRYVSVKNAHYPTLNNAYGYLWNPSIVNPLILYYSEIDPTAQYNANFIVQDVNNNGISGVSVTMDNTQTKITNSIGGVSFGNVSSGTHTFMFSKNGYQSAQRTIDIQLQYATFTQTLFKENQIVQPTVSPTAYPTIQPTVQPTITPIEKPSNLAESIEFGLAKIFGINSLNTINLVFALLIVLFPAVVGAVVTNQALGFVAGGMIGFIFALGIGLIPLWVFFSMVMISVIYLVLTRGTNEGF